MVHSPIHREIRRLPYLSHVLPLQNLGVHNWTVGEEGWVSAAFPSRYLRKLTACPRIKGGMGLRGICMQQTMCGMCAEWWVWVLKTIGMGYVSFLHCRQKHIDRNYCVSLLLYGQVDTIKSPWNGRHRDWGQEKSSSTVTLIKAPPNHSRCPTSETWRWLREHALLDWYFGGILFKMWTLYLMKVNPYFFCFLQV